VRTVPGNGLIVANAADAALAETLAMGCWTPVETASPGGADGVDWSARKLAADGSRFEVWLKGRCAGVVQWEQLGDHNIHNALTAIAAARHGGVPVSVSVAALTAFSGVRRRLERRGEVDGVTVYDDFAHHPTAIATTLHGLRENVGDGRILAVLEPRSNTMRLGVHRDRLASSLTAADRVWLYRPADLGWDLQSVADALEGRARVCESVEDIVAELASDARPGDRVLIMSNGGFENIHERLLAALRARERA